MTHRRALVVTGLAGALGVTLSMIVGSAGLAAGPTTEPRYDPPVGPPTTEPRYDPATDSAEAAAIAATGSAATEFDPLAFFSDVFAAVESDPALIDKMRGLTVADSVAFDFLTYLTSYATAFAAMLGPPTISVSIETTDPSIALSVCFVDDAQTLAAPSTTVPTTTVPSATPDSCAVFADFVTAADGRLESFTIDGRSLDGRFGHRRRAAALAASVVGAGFERISDDALLVPSRSTRRPTAITLDWENGGLRRPVGHPHPALVRQQPVVARDPGRRPPATPSSCFPVPRRAA